LLVIYPSIQGHIVGSQRKADRVCNLLALSRNSFEAFIDWGIEILLSAVGTHPSCHIIKIDRLPVKREPDSNLPVFHDAFTKFTKIGCCHSSSSSCTYAVIIKRTPEVRNRHTTQARRPSVVVPVTS